MDLIVDPVMDPLETHGRSLYTNNFELAIATLIACLLIFNKTNIKLNDNAAITLHSIPNSQITDQIDQKLLN